MSDLKSAMRPVLGTSMLVLAVATAAIYALIGWGGVFVFGLGASALDTYFLIYPFLFLLILLTGLLSLRLMAGLLLLDFIVYWAVRVGINWPRSTLNPVQSIGDMIALGIVVLGITAYLLFPQELRRRSVIGIVRDLRAER